MSDEIFKKEKVTVFKTLNCRYKYCDDRLILYIVIYGSFISILFLIYLLFLKNIKYIFLNIFSRLWILFDVLFIDKIQLIVVFTICIILVILFFILLKYIVLLHNSCKLQYTISYKIDKNNGVTHLTTYDPDNNDYTILSLTYPAIVTVSFKFLYSRLSSYAYLFYLIKKRPIFSLLFLFPEFIWFMLYIFLLRYYICKQYPICILILNIFLIIFLMIKMYKFCRQYLYRLFNLYQLMLAIEDINFNLSDEFENFLNSVVTHGYEYLFKSLINNLKIFLPF